MIDTDTRVFAKCPKYGRRHVKNKCLIFGKEWLVCKLLHHFTEEDDSEIFSITIDDLGLEWIASRLRKRENRSLLRMVGKSFQVSYGGLI